jgi:IS4 transposase
MIEGIKSVFADARCWAEPFEHIVLGFASIIGGTQDGRPLRRYRRRWRVERLFAWLHHFRRLVIRWEYHVENFFGMVRLGCIQILLRQL